ncbi:hypothetical protein IPC1241_19155 [Pseudomonas aeruginosa]|uniref:Uncharacterized protein n=1 Tax=Pseudomonas aeruginosa TaxID=287 RepID=A0A0N9ZPY2_PSEAI|nr:hypothetical protein [Pseudomonas aeruginosa]ALI58944.1 hypothetical protein CCBH4851_00240 [Pseudomonas aeruginosa]AOX32958.1 hypothetical protein PA8281_05696 [Pseudomonas aeruginosa]APB57042.1 hypothetical protein PA7790_05758 [Pseudomonas aeruginosa]ARU38915.1 hypothetical protein AL347_31410 [Pseudomonas aeruginosa]KSJ55049.1 hypothetical protein APA05_05360 [Pseudomonas aeruginosa]
MSSTQHQLIEQCVTRLRGIVEALDNIHDSTPHRWSTDLDDVHSSAESLLALINDQAPPSDAERWREQFDCMQLQRDHHRERADAALARVAELEKQEPVAWVEVIDRDYGPYNFHGKRLLPKGKHQLYAAPVAQAQHSVPEEFIGRLSEFLAQRGATGKALLRELRDMLAAAPGTEVPQAWLDVQAERRRQVEAEGWTPEHDDEHSHGQMARAAACYALAGSSAPNDGTAALLVSLAWPWDEQWWKPSTARRDMVKACALALAEIERLDRATATQGGPRDA